MSDTTAVHGAVATGFEPVHAAFERNFTDFGDQGASFALYVDGEIKVDLWGGVADVSTGRPWDTDTIAIMYSATKGATSILTSLLSQRGDLELDAEVASVWPEFAANGKGDITIRQILSHQAGLPALGTTLTRDEIIAGTPVVEALAGQAPLWEPGTRHGYHALTFGWLVGEVVRRATGRSVGSLFASEIAGPLGLDLHIGLPESEHSRVAPLVDAPPPDPALLAAIDAMDDPDVKAFIQRMISTMTDPSSLLSRVLSSNGSLPTPHAATWNDARIYAMEQPAANGIGNARSLARLYGACVATVDDVRLLSDDTLDAVTAEQTAGPDEVILAANRFGTGFMLPSASLTLLSDASFGHQGAGGALGFADRKHRVGFGYVQNQLGGGPLGDPRVSGLLDAVKASLGVG